jgi:hypothetical protein
MKLLPALLFAVLTATSHAQDVIIPANQPWSALHTTDGVEPASLDATNDFYTTWYLASGYDGPAFNAPAPGPFRYGTITYFTQAALTATVLPTPASGIRFTTYFKTTFTASKAYPEVIAQILADDGAVIYLDGVEIKRVNMANSTDANFYTYADGPSRTEDGADTESSLLTISLGSISAGPHTLAVSLHNAASDSSDLGLYLTLLGSQPPPPTMLTTDFGGTTNPISAEATVQGWNSARSGTFTMNGATAATLRSNPVDLSTIGQANAILTVYTSETSTGTNFETADYISATLEATLDDNSIAEIRMVPATDDLNDDGLISGDEMSSATTGPEWYVYYPRHFSATIPASVKSVRLLVSGSADSTSESLRWGAARITDRNLLADSDRDGALDQDEIIAGTDPADPNSVFRMESGELDQDGVGTDGFLLGANTIAGRTYAVETTEADLTLWDSLGFVTASTSNGRIIITFGGTYPEYFHGRMRPVP